MRIVGAHILSQIIIIFFILNYLSFETLSNDQITNDRCNYIYKIQFKGNYKTKPQIMLQEMLIQEGDAIDLQKIEISRQAILDLGLFKTVNTQLIDHSIGKILLITVEEKYFFLPFPRIGRSSDGDFYYGGKLEFNNLFGRNQTIETLYIKKKLQDSYLKNEQSMYFYYNYPRIMGRPYQFVFDFENKQSELENTINDLTGVYIENNTHLSCILGYWLHHNGPSKGWQINSGIILDWKEYDYQKGSPDLYYDVNTIALIAGINYNAVNNLGYNQKGKYFKYQLACSLKALGSHINYNQHTLVFRYYYPLPGFSYTNFNFQFISEYISSHYFDDSVFKLGSSSTIRGYSRESIQGDMYMHLNMELLSPIGFNVLRGVLFTDIGNAYKTVKDIDMLDQKIGVGFGLRWKIKALVRTDLRLDFAYGVQEDMCKIYIGAKAMF